MFLNRNITPVITDGVQELNIPLDVMARLYGIALRRWVSDNNDYFTTVESVGINLQISNGNEIIENKLISEFPNIEQMLYIQVDDYGEGSKEGLVITILLPDEY